MTNFTCIYFLSCFSMPYQLLLLCTFEWDTEWWTGRGGGDDDDDDDVDYSKELPWKMHKSEKKLMSASTQLVFELATTQM